MKQVYLTALTNERYIPGVMALARSLREVVAKHPLAVMVPTEKAESLSAAIRNYGILDLPNVFLLPRNNILVSDNFDLTSVIEADYSYWRDTFFKLQSAGCTEFDKIILLDSDMLVVKNLDHLFAAPSFTATVCGKCVHDDWHSLNSGLLVLEPSDDLHRKLISLIIPAIESRRLKGLQAGDQDVFHLAFPNWSEHPELFIPEKYNVCWGWISDLCKKEKCGTKDFYIIHFTGKMKPWDFGKFFWLRQFISFLWHKKNSQILYKVFIWSKYRNLCKHT